MSDWEYGTTLVPLPWHSAQWQLMTDRLRTGQLPHAVMLHGEAGNGKEQFAMALAQRLLCASPVADMACGQCKGCQLSKAGTHPDLKLVHAEAVNKLIKVGQIREVVEFVAKKSQLNGYKLVVIAPCERLNVNASNALLKSLEEPGEKTLLLLVCHQPSQLLATIRSRCQMLEFITPAREVAQQWLTQLIDDPKKVEQLLTVSGGAPLRALQMSGSPWLDDRQAIAQQWLAVATKKADPIKTASQWNQYPLIELLTWLISWQIDLAKLLANGSEAMVNLDLRQAFSGAKPFIQLDKLLQCYDHLLWLYRVAQSSANPNPQLLLEEILLKWSQVSVQS